jgi:hypothetical protein
MCGVPGDNALHKLMTTLDRWRNEHNSTSVLPTTQLAKIKPTYHSAYFSGTKRYLFQESSLPKQMRTPTTQQTNIKSNWVGFRHSEKNTFEGGQVRETNNQPILHEGKLSKEVLTNARSATTRWTSVVTYGKTKLQDNQQCTENKPLFIQKLKVVLYVSSTIVCFRK